jgi:hypothetical protein
MDFLSFLRRLIQLMVGLSGETRQGGESGKND